MRGDLLGFGVDLLHGLADGGAADRDRARAIRAHAELHLVGVAVDDLHLADGNAETFGDQLRKRRLMALAVAVPPGEDFDGTAGIDAHFRPFPQPHTATSPPPRLPR